MRKTVNESWLYLCHLRMRVGTDLVILQCCMDELDSYFNVFVLEKQVALQQVFYIREHSLLATVTQFCGTFHKSQMLITIVTGITDMQHFTNQLTHKNNGRRHKISS